MDGAAAGVDSSRRRPGSSILAAALALTGFAVVLWGGYGGGWRWTGFAHRAALWDWLHVFMLPLALAVAPLWLRHRRRLGRLRHLLLGLGVAGFAVLVVLGYVLDLSWTGFPGNTLWDWLELLVLPLAVALIPVWTELADGVRPGHLLLAAAGLAFLTVALVGGYAESWRWTGFRGNTLFDWLQLFFAPLLLPIVIVPFLVAWMSEKAVSAEPGVAADDQA